MGKSKSNSRNSPTCENCWMCTDVAKMHEFNDLSKLLVTVSRWDLNIGNQFHNNDWRYECLVCNYKTNVFNDWKCHIMSISHLAYSHTLKNLFSLVGTRKNDKVVLYGTKKCLNQYEKDHFVGNCSIGIPILMSEVMRRFLHNLPPLYYCSHCKKFSNTPIHVDKKSLASLKVPIEYFCKSCRVYFYSSPEMMDCHSLTVEHLTIKCYIHLSSTAKLNPKKMKLLEPNTEQLDQSEEIKKLPIIVLNGFLNTSTTFGKCKICDSSVIWNIKSIVSHLSNCQYRYNLTELNTLTSSVYNFECTICEYSTEVFTEFMKHIVTQKHLLICCKEKCYSFFCEECNSLKYSHKLSIINHLLLFHNIKKGKVPALSLFMSQVFKNLNKNPNKTKIINYYGNTGSRGLSKVSHLCSTCKIQFHTKIDYNIHMNTSEHIILKFMSPNISVTIKDNLKTPAVQSIVIVPSTKKYDSIKVDNIEQRNNTLVNKSPFNIDDPLQGNVENLQKLLPANNNLPNKSYENAQDGSPESNKNVESTLGQSQHCNQYRKYFKHKIKLLNLLRQYKDRVLNTLSYYCIECDIMCEEKLIWDKHNETKHLSHSNRTTTFCSTCSMLIVGKNANDHNDTIEHGILLKFVQSLKPVEEDLIQETTVMESVKSSTLTNKETVKKRSEMNIVGSTSKCPVKNIKSNVSSNLIQKASLLNKESSLVMKNTLPPEDKDIDQNKYEMNLRTYNEISSTSSYSISTPSTVLYQTNVENKKQENMNCMDILKNKDSCQFNNKVNKNISCEPVKIHDVTPSNSLVIQPTELNQTKTNVDMKKHEEMNCVNLFMFTCDLHLHKEPLTQIKTEIISDDIDMELHDEVASISSLSTVPLSTHVSEHFKTKETFDEDKAYGKYIALRLKHLKDKTVKQNIILETFDFLKRKLVPEPIDNRTPTNEFPLNDGNFLNLPLTNVSSENVDGIDLQEDSDYGKYVTQRLRNIKNEKLKQDIKLEIDNIFYVKMRQSVI